MKDKDYDILVAYLQHDLSPEEEQRLKARLADDEALQAELTRLQELYDLMEDESSFDVPKGLEHDFAEILRNEKGRIQKRNLWISWVGRVAAAIALIAVGVFAGTYFSGNSANDEQMLALEKEIKANRALILQSLNESSASQRFMGVRATSKIVEPDRELIDALVEVMNTDDNTNVRLAAVRALGGLADNVSVRNALLESLVNQSDPLVQVALIEILVTLQEKRVIPSLERIIKSDTIIEAVKDEAYWGVMKLS